MKRRVGTANEGAAPLDPDTRREQARVMEAVRRLAAGVAHDLNNVLLVVQGYAEMALAERDAGPQTLEHLAEIRKASARAASLVADLLTVGQRGRVAARMLALNETILHLLPSIKATAGEAVEVRCALAEDLPPLLADEDQIGRLAAVLAARAAAVMPDGGTLTIRTDAAAPAGDPRVLLTFSDTGTAVSPELRHRLFEPYLPGNPEGKGLGLTMAYSIAQRLGGEIDVQCPPEGGTSFTLSLPGRSAVMEEEKANGQREEDRRVPGRVDGQAVNAARTILIAEDDDGLRTLATKILVREGYRVIAARDGHEAVELFSLNRDAVCLALLDEVMPHLGGRAALARMRALLPGLPAIICTGYTWRLDGKMRDHGDAFDILSKPWQPGELLRMVREGVGG